MKPALLFLLLLVPFVVAQDDDVDESDVIVLTEDTFDGIVDVEDLMLVEFYAPWCGHCKRLKPEFAKAATELLKNDPPVKLAKVDATAESALGSRFEVRGYPTLKVFRNGRPSDYQGPREAAGIVKYMKKQSGPASKPVKTEADLEKFLKDENNDFWLLGLFSDVTSKAAAAFALLSGQMREDFIFLKSSEPELFAKYNVAEGENVILALKKYDEKVVKFEGEMGTKPIKEWIVEHSLPMVGEFSEKTAERYEKRGLPVAKLFIEVDFEGGNARHTKYYTNRLKKLAEKFKGQVAFTVANRPTFAEQLKELGLDSKKVPFFIEDKGKKFVYSGKFKLDKLLAWVEDFVAGKVAKHVKSEEAPVSNNGPVTIVVGKTFEEMVRDPEKDVMIYFYAPWCGHCKALEPKFKELGKKFKHVDTVRIAKIDATANDYPDDFKVSGFPTIYFVPAGKKPKVYSGAREVSDLKSYIKKNAKIPFSFGKKKRKRKRK